MSVERNNTSEPRERSDITWYGKPIQWGRGTGNWRLKCCSTVGLWLMRLINQGAFIQSRVDGKGGFVLISKLFFLFSCTCSIYTLPIIIGKTFVIHIQYFQVYFFIITIVVIPITLLNSSSSFFFFFFFFFFVFFFFFFFFFFLFFFFHPTL